jgi:3-hydroxyisobutyrate dehydrogenase-like beta-hydroxyacid dehydrogenase
MAARSDVIISMITDDPALEEVTIGLQGAFKGTKSGAVFVDMSTVSPLVSDRVAKAAEKMGIQYLRAPVSGSTVYAEKGILTVLASGPKDSYDNCMDIFRPMSKNNFSIGSREEARYHKLLLNMMLVLHRP